ncbi:MAG: endo-1,4-beta-xylanase [Chitinispirillaceae bacterium]|nr:endo-1,4-beta-xylanase [Chitinispirillaceae bacterium]
MHFRSGILIITLIAAGSFTANGQEESLRAYADKIGLNIGTCIFGRTYQSGQYSEILTRDFNTVVAENEMKAQAMQPQQGQFSFGTADAMVAFAQEHDMKVRGHTLVWHAQNPSWLSGGSWTRETLLKQMEAHITGVVSHFKGKVFEWDVVNEAFGDRATNGVNPLRGSFWQRTIGDDFLDSAFTYAHRADPDAILFYNDYSTSNVNSKSTSVYNKLKEMIENGVPVSGVGFQSHQTLEDYDEEFIASLKENFDRFAALGLRISVTELDIRITLPSGGNDWVTQAEYYREYLQTCLENSACKTFMIWGFTDRYSWIPGVFPGTGEALIFDDNFEPKPAYDELLETLKNYKPDAIRSFGGFRNNPASRLFTAGNFSRSIFNLRGEKIGTYSFSPTLLISAGGRPPAASQTVVIENGKRPMVLMR